MPHRHTVTFPVPAAIGGRLAEHLGGAADQFPADAGDDLPAIGEEAPNGIDAAGGGGAAELGLLLDEHGARPGTADLHRRSHPRRAHTQR